VHCTKISTEFEFGVIDPTRGSPHPKMWRFAESLREKSTNGCGRGRRGNGPPPHNHIRQHLVMQLCRPPVLRGWENQHMLSSLLL